MPRVKVNGVKQYKYDKAGRKAAAAKKASMTRRTPQRQRRAG